MKLRGIIAYTTVAVTLVTLTACHSVGGIDRYTAGGPGMADPGASPAAKSFAAPTRYSLEHSIPLPESAGRGKVSLAGVEHPLPVALHNGTVFISRPDGLERVDGYGIKKSFPVIITPEHEPVTRLENLLMMGSNPAEAPLITSFSGKTWALTALVSKVTGSGTATSHDVVELMAVDTANAGIKAWFTEIVLTDAYPAADRDEAHVVGRGADTVIVYARGQLFGVDMKSRQRVWTAPGTYDESVVVAGGRVVALRKHSDNHQVVALDAASGKDVWASPRTGTDLSAAGPDAVMASEKGPDAGSGRTYLLDAATGDIRSTLPKDAPGSDCGYDGVAFVVCTSDGGNHEVAAYDPKTGQERWRLPDAAGTRVAPYVTLVRAGLIYATAHGNPVVLDAASGKDKESQPGIAPYVADGYVGITETKDGSGVSAYRAVG